MSILSDSPETSQRSPLYLLDPGTKREARNNEAMQQEKYHLTLNH